MMSEVGPDQKPLIPIHKKSLLNAPKRLQRMLLGALKYDYEVVYKMGTDMFVADTLSRALEKNSTGRMKTEKEEIFQTDDWYGPLIWRNMSISEELQSATRQDPDLCVLADENHPIRLAGTQERGASKPAAVFSIQRRVVYTERADLQNKFRR